jgi:molybdate transport system substrate-binding protein
MVGLGLALAACAGGPGRDDGTVGVLAAASLTDAFTELADAYEAANPEVTIELSFGPSSGLREQVLAGAPADVFASADVAEMAALVDAGAARQPTDFARNGLQVVVPAGNPAGITGLTDFARTELLLGLCAEEVPCGRLARSALEAAGVTPALDTTATDVRALLTQVASGDLDAGIVYRTDVLSAGAAVEGIDLPAAADVTATYPIAVLRDAADADAAEGFVAFVRSTDGQDILASHGFRGA